MYGNVYVESSTFPIITNIKKMFSDSESFIFLDKNNDLYGYGVNDHDKFLFNKKLIHEPTKLNNFSDIKYVFMRNARLITVSDDYVVSVSGIYKRTYQINPSVKTEELGEELYILDKDGILSIFSLKHLLEIKKFTDVKDFMVNGNYLTMLLNSNEVEVYMDNLDVSVGSDVIKGNVILLGSEELLIDNILNHIVINDDNVEFVNLQI